MVFEIRPIFGIRYQFDGQLHKVNMQFAGFPYLPIDMEFHLKGILTNPYIFVFYCHFLQDFVCQTYVIKLKDK